MSFADLNLADARADATLYGRVRRTARMLCRRLDFAYPITAAGSPPCYDMAVQDALYQADNAIQVAHRPAPASKPEDVQTDQRKDIPAGS